MRPTLTEREKFELDNMLESVKLSAILDHVSATTFEAADQCDGEGRDMLMQQASVVSAAALFSKTWCDA